MAFFPTGQNPYGGRSSFFGQRQDPYDPNRLAWTLAMAQMQQASGARDDSRQRFDLLQQLAKNQNEAQGRAYQANENRYLDILQMLGQTRNRVMGDLQGYGQGQVDDLNRSYANREKDLTFLDTQDRARLASTGRLGTSAMQSQNTTQARRLGDLTYDRQAALNRLNDDIINRRVGTDISLTGGNVPQFMERRTDSYPDSSSLNRLAGMLGQIPQPQLPTMPIPPGGLQATPNYMLPNNATGGGRFQSRNSREEGSSSMMFPPTQNPTSGGGGGYDADAIAQNQAAAAKDYEARKLFAAMSDASHTGYAGQDDRRWLQNLAALQGHGYQVPGAFLGTTGGAQPTGLTGGTYAGTGQFGPDQMLSGLLQRLYGDATRVPLGVRDPSFGTRLMRDPRTASRFKDILAKFQQANPKLNLKDLLWGRLLGA